MSVEKAFFEQGFRVAMDAMVEAVGKAGLHLRPETLAPGVARRCRQAFRRIATIVRRLIFLMALQVELPPVRPAGPRAPATPPLTETDVEDVTASFGPQPRGLALAPGKTAPPPDIVPSIVKGLYGVHKGCPVPPGPLLARWAALHRVLKDPEAHARRLAFTLRRWRQAGEAAPVCFPLGHEHRLPRELGLVARVLPQLIRRGLETWNDTG